MGRGGARARSGPAPDPNALRRDRKEDQAGWVTLPAEGREGPAPEWPLTRAVKREAVLWEREWARPQAVMWERLGLEVEVALYVRSLAAAEKASAPVNARTLVRQQQEALGLSIPGLARNRWRIEDAEKSPASSAATSGRPRATARKPARERFTVLDGQRESS